MEVRRTRLSGGMEKKVERGRTAPEGRAELRVLLRTSARRRMTMQIFLHWGRRLVWMLKSEVSMAPILVTSFEDCVDRQGEM